MQPRGSVPVEARPISRADLPENLSAAISDEAIEFANQLEFASLRAEWEGPELVDQIDYQLEFRAQVDYMSTDPAYLARLLADKPTTKGEELLGLYMTPSEWQEMERRKRLGEKMEAIVEAVTGYSFNADREGEVPDYGSNFAGIWQDQKNGGRLVLAVVNKEALDFEGIEAAVGAWTLEKLEVIEQKYNFQETEAFRNQLHKELRTLGISHDIEAVKSDRGRLLEVRVPGPEELPPSLGNGLPSDAYAVVEGQGVTLAGNPSSTHWLIDQQPGLEIWVRGGSGATWGFNGHTSSYHYIVTVAHLLPPPYAHRDPEDPPQETIYAGWVGSDLEIDQNGDPSRNITPGNTFVYSVFDTIDYTMDAARIESWYADDNCYHTVDHGGQSAHCGATMAKRAWLNSWEEGADISCASLGSSDVYRCGFIMDENLGPPGGANRVRVAIDANGGDSGAGFKYADRIDGILTSIGMETDAFFVPAYWVQVYLGNGYFFFNCAEGHTVRTNPGDWGACPGVDA